MTKEPQALNSEEEWTKRFTIFTMSLEMNNKAKSIDSKDCKNFKNAWNKMETIDIMINCIHLFVKSKIRLFLIIIKSPF